MGSGHNCLCNHYEDPETCWSCNPTGYYKKKIGEMGRMTVAFKEAEDWRLWAQKLLNLKENVSQMSDKEMMKLIRKGFKK